MPSRQRGLASATTPSGTSTSASPVTTMVAASSPAATASGDRRATYRGAADVGEQLVLRAVIAGTTARGEDDGQRGGVHRRPVSQPCAGSPLTAVT